MRKFALLGGLVMTYGTLSALFRQSPKEQWQSKIEREVRKHDVWVEASIDQDYTIAHSPTVTGKVRIYSFPRHVVQAMRELGMHGFSAAYSPELDILTLPELDDDKDEEVIDSIDHELWHAIFDSRGRKGIFYSSEFSGPSLEEIAEYTRRKTNDGSFQALRNHLRSEEELERIKGVLSQFAAYAGIVQQSMAIAKKIDDLAADKDYAAYEAHINKEERDTSAADRKKLDERLYAFAEKAREILGELQKWGTDIESRKEMPPLDALVTFRNNIIEKYKALEEYKGIDKEYGALRDRTQNMYHTAEDGFFQAQIDEMKALRDAEKNDEARKRLTEEIAAFEEMNGFRRQARAINAMPDIGEMFSGQLSVLQSFLGSFVTAGNVYAIDQVLNNPDEVMARVVDSVYSLYFGEVTQNKFPLGTEDLDFLERFMFRGEPLFRKGIERYRVGLQLKGEVGAAEMKRRLEYATQFSHQGKTYHWPAAQFKIHGTIPAFDTSEYQK